MKRYILEHNHYQDCPREHCQKVSQRRQALEGTHSTKRQSQEGESGKEKGHFGKR